MLISFSIIEQALATDPRWAVWSACLCALCLIVMAAVRVNWTVAQRIAQWLIALILRTLYRVRVHGINNLPAKGPGVLVCNHVSWIDGALMLAVLPRRTRMIAHAGNFGNPLMNFLAWISETILMTGGPKSIRESFASAREALAQGQLVGIFPEGGLTRTGQIQSFKPGLMRIIKDLDVPVIPVYIDQMWGSIFSFSGGKSIWKFPSALRRPASIHFGTPVQRPKSIHEVRQAVQFTGARAVSKRQRDFVAPARSFIRSCRKRLFQFKAADSVGTEGTGGALLMRTLIARRLMRKHLLADDEQNVGILIPPAFGACVVNMALAIDRRTAVNLNYTVSSAIMNQCIEQAGIKHVLTTRKVMEKLDLQLDCEVFFLEDLRERVTLWDKLAGAASAFVLPARMLEWSLGLHQIKKHDVLTLIFTSGSTGTPKGVMLTQENIATNVLAIDQVVRLNRRDVLVGVLPFFHSFGYTVTLWGAMSLNIGGVYHFSPLDATQVGKLCEKYRVTILLATPTFLRGYLRRCTPEQFASLDVVVAGAEKLPAELCEAFEKKFGVRPTEGYGTTELSPLVAVNVPPSRRGDNYQVDCKEGTVGRPVPNVAAKIVHLDSGQVVSANEPGALWITGPNVMKGYLKQPDLTGEVIQEGWYNTGDVALIDEDGFVKITGRMSRFSKIGGEMVPHLKIEETLCSLLSPEEQDETRIAVTAVPDAKKGERLIVLHTQLSKTPSELCQGLTEAGLPNLYIPAVTSFFEVPQLPLLGTGKLDLKAMKQMAEETAAAAVK